MPQRSFFRFATPLLPLLLVAPWGATRAETRIERELDLAPGGRFVLDTDSGGIEVVGTARSGAKVVITSRRDDIESVFDLRFEERPGEVEVRVEKKGKLSSWFHWNRGSDLKFEIEVPRQTELDVDTAGGSISVESIDGASRLDTSGGSIEARNVGGDLSVDTSGGAITIESVQGNVRADTSGGRIVVRDVRGDVRADTSGGSIQIGGVGGAIHAETSGGGIRIEDAGGHVYAETSGGPITASAVAGSAMGGELSTSGGGIEVRLDPSAGLEIDASSSGGSVVCDVPVTVQGKVSRTSLHGRVGSGGPVLKLRTSGGGIRIRAL